ncbi:MTH1187 family thiamine-binding protein [bacterium]|nr:MTH1187 family thiamine-binding protein [bacterium]
MVLLEFSMYPTDKGASVSDYVKRSLEIIDDSGLSYRLGPMGTTLEGEWDEVMAVVRDCYEHMRGDCGRIACQIKIDAREGGGGRLDGKVEVLRKKTGRDLSS